MLYSRSTWGFLSGSIHYTDGAGAPLYNNGLGWEILAGPRGARVRHIHIEPILLLANDIRVWHLLMFRGRLPKNTQKYQGAFSNLTFPQPAPNTYDLDLLYYAQLIPSQPSTSQPFYPHIVDFEDDTGPHVSANEYLSAMMLPCFAGNGAATSDAFLTGLILGGDDDVRVDPIGNKQWTARSMPRALVG